MKGEIIPTIIKSDPDNYFVDRTSEDQSLAHIVEILENNKGVILGGESGIGKTSLSIEIGWKWKKNNDLKRSVYWFDPDMYLKFKEQFIEAGIKQFGSGWAWLIVDDGKLSITSTANQDTPISEGKTPILGVDVWEHAYYLNYQNKRPDYLAAWFNVINWDKVNELFEKG